MCLCSAAWWPQGAVMSSLQFEGAGEEKSKRLHSLKSTAWVQLECVRVHFAMRGRMNTRQCNTNQCVISHPLWEPGAPGRRRTAVWMAKTNKAPWEEAGVWGEYPRLVASSELWHKAERILMMSGDKEGKHCTQWCTDRLLNWLWGVSLSAPMCHTQNVRALWPRPHLSK